MLQAPVSIHAGVVIQILCHNDGAPASDDCLAAVPAPVRLSRQGQFLLRELTADWGGRARAGLVLVAGEGWRTWHPSPSQEKAEGRLWLRLRLGDTRRLTMDDEMGWEGEGGWPGYHYDNNSTRHSPAKTTNSGHYHSLVIDSWCAWVTTFLIRGGFNLDPPNSDNAATKP